MENTSAYYKAISEAYQKVASGARTINRVSHAADQLQKIYDEQYGVSGRRERDEPTEPTKTQYQRVADKKAYDADMKVWKQRTQSTLGKERLKRKGAVPVRAGKKLFEEFMLEAAAATGKKDTQETKERDHKRLKQVYLAARSLEYDKWVMFITEMLPKY